MSSNLDMSLNDLIKKNRKTRLQNRRRKLGGDKAGIGRGDRDRGNLRGRRNKDDGSKILISNLAYKVTSKDLKVNNLIQQKELSFFLYYFNTYYKKKKKKKKKKK